MELSLIRNAHFHKITCFALEPILDGKWRGKCTENETNVPPNIDEKSMSFFIEKSIDFLSENGAKREPKGNPEGPQNRLNSSIFRGPPSGPPKGGQMEPQGRQNELKMESKWIPNGANMD